MKCTIMLALGDFDEVLGLPWLESEDEVEFCIIFSLFLMKIFCSKVCISILFDVPLRELYK